MDTALVGVGGAILGLLLSKVLELLLDRRRRHEKMLDLLTAIHAEISAGRIPAEMQSAAAEREYAEKNETPFATADRSDFVFEAIKSDLSILPIDVVHEVVGYYKLAVQSNLYTDNLLHPQFIAQTPGEKRKYVEGLLDLSDKQERAARVAMAAIEHFMIKYGLDLSAKRAGKAADALNQRTNGADHI